MHGIVAQRAGIYETASNQPANGFLMELRWLHLAKFEQYDKLVVKSASLEPGVIDYNALLIRVWGFEHANPKDPVAYGDLSHALPLCLTSTLNRTRLRVGVERLASLHLLVHLQ